MGNVPAEPNRPAIRGRCVRQPVCYPDPQQQGPERPGAEMIMAWWPGWSSIEGAAKWGDIFFWTGFAFLVLLAGCEILSKVYGWRKDTLVAMRDDLMSVAHDIRPQEPELGLGDARARHDAEVAGPRAR